MKNINVAIIGAGKISKPHITALSILHILHPDLNAVIKPIIIADINEKAAKNAASNYNIDKWTTNYYNAIENKDVDAVLVLTPPYTHKEIVIETLKQGKHVFCEKPLAINSKDAYEMWVKAKESGLRNMVGFNYRKINALIYAKRLIERKSIGDLMFLMLRFNEDFGINIDNSWRYKKEFSGGGVLMDLGIHLIDLVHYFTDDEINTIDAIAKVIIPNREVEDYIAVHFITGKRKIIGFFESSWIAIGKKNSLEVEIYGDKGSLHYDLEQPNEIHVYLNNGNNELLGYRRILIGPQHPYGDSLVYPNPGAGLGYEDSIINELYEFFKGVLHDDFKISPDFYDGYLANKIVDLIYDNVKQKYSYY